MAFNINELTSEQIQKGMACKSLEEFQAFVKGQGFDLEEDEAQAFFEEMYEMELTDEELEAVAGGNYWDGTSAEECPDYHDGRRRRKSK